MHYGYMVVVSLSVGMTVLWAGVGPGCGGGGGCGCGLRHAHCEPECVPVGAFCAIISVWGLTVCSAPVCLRCCLLL